MELKVNAVYYLTAGTDYLYSRDISKPCEVEFKEF